jgi:hypothetical protein
LNILNRLKEKFRDNPYTFHATCKNRFPFRVDVDTIRFSRENNNIICMNGLLVSESTGYESPAFKTAEEALDYYDEHFRNRKV